MKRRRRGSGPRTQPFETLGGRLGVQAMLFLAFALNLFLAIEYDRGVAEVALALFGLAIAVLGGWDVYCDHQYGLKLRAQIVYETTRATMAETEVGRLRARTQVNTAHTRWGAGR
ncbi:MAG: hypothetical protein ABWX96_17620 [Propionibacteriaceae bacterium]